MNVLATLPLSVLIGLLMLGCQSSSHTDSSSNSASQSPVDDPVGGDESPGHGGGFPTGTGELSLNSAYTDLLESLAGYQLDALAVELEQLRSAAAASALGVKPLAPGVYTVSDRNDAVEVPLARTQYVCELGGELLVESARFNSAAMGNARTGAFDHYRFDQCRLAGQGEQLLDGDVRIQATVVFGNRFDSRQHSIRWEDFSWYQGNGREIQASATIEASEFNSIDISQSRVAAIELYSHVDGAVFIESIDGGQFSQSSEIGESGSERGFFMSAQGRVRDRSGVPVTITTDPAFEQVIMTAQPDAQEVPFRGQLTMSADDGSRLSITAQGERDSLARPVDIVFQAAGGAESLSTVELLVLPVFLP